MEKNIWSDFGLIMIDGDDFENGYEALEESLFDDIKNSDSPEKPLIIEENRNDERKIHSYKFYLMSSSENNCSFLYKMNFLMSNL